MRMTKDTTITSSRGPRKARGFTMLEVMVVVAIAAILAAVGLPSLRAFIASQRIKTASFDMIAMMTLARSEAIKRNAPVQATPVNNDWKQGWVVAPTSGTLTISRQGAMKANDITITCLQGGSAQTCVPIVYNASGRLTSTYQSIQIVSSSLSSAQNTRCISVSLGGRPYSKKGSC
jgi:type IV fimbrial biogenesis protein FimT